VQYAAHLPAWLVEIHVLGAVSLTIGVVSFQLAQIARDRDLVVIELAPITPTA